MIKFFRNIRKHSFIQHKISKYVLYAIGEIILIVFGILIALQVNNWNENRIKRNNIHDALIDLKSQIDYNYKWLDYLTKSRSKAEQNLYNYNILISDDNITVSEKANAILPDLFYRESFPTEFVEISIRNTGLLNYIKSDTLKYLLMNINQNYNSLKNREDNYYDSNQKLQDYLFNKIPAKLVKGIYQGNWESYYPSDFQNIRDAQMQYIVEEIEYYNLISNCIAQLHIQVIKGKSILRKLNTIRELIDKEIIEYK